MDCLVQVGDGRSRSRWRERGAEGWNLQPMRTRGMVITAVDCVMDAHPGLDCTRRDVLAGEDISFLAGQQVVVVVVFLLCCCAAVLNNQGLMTLRLPKVAPLLLVLLAWRIWRRLALVALTTTSGATCKQQETSRHLPAVEN